MEIDEAAVGQARENVIRSPWKERVEVVQADFRKYRSSDKFDVIVSNPPYYIDSLECPDRQRTAARHNDSLSYEDLLEGVSGLLTENGFFTVVIPADVAERVKKIASIKKLYAVRQLNVITKPGGIPKRVLITFSFSNQECIVEELLTELARHQYSEEYMTRRGSLKIRTFKRIDKIRRIRNNTILRKGSTGRISPDFTFTSNACSSFPS